ncbi:MAG: DMT family transporter [Hyphomicrobiaceae bacterium]|nr:DMT family transporter [Hyphomicrobiaceae bacterium]MCC0023241.1 DMT family transporter [Hyphomicrobiaceae bacterium]
MNLNRRTAALLLAFATMLWGFAFIAQKNAMEYMGAFTFIGARYVLGGLVVLPLAIMEYRRAVRRPDWQGWAIIAAVSFNFLAGSWLQQTGLRLTTATNGGFLTGLYVFFVPLILLAAFRIRPHIMVWICAPLAMAGLYTLNGGRLDQLNVGDIYVVGSSFFWALHVLLLGYAARLTAMPIFVSAISFLSAGLLAGAGALMFEAPTLSAMSAGWIEIAYAGIFSTAIAFTLQAIGQMHVPSANAAIILSGEALFAAIGGAVVLGERLTPMGYLGAAMIFTAIVLVETVPAIAERRQKNAA